MHSESGDNDEPVQNDGRQVKVTLQTTDRQTFAKTSLQNKTRNSSGDEIANVNFLYDDFIYVL